MTAAARDEVTLRVSGRPRTQGSLTAVHGGDGRVKLLSGKTPQARTQHKAWRGAVAAASRRALAARDWRPLTGDSRHGTPLAASMSFTLARPKSRPKFLRWCAVKPDLDKLIRAVLDGIGNDPALIRDDADVSAITATKRYAADGEAEGVVVRLVVLGHGDRVDSSISEDA